MFGGIFVGFFLWWGLIAETVSADKKLIAETVSADKLLFAETLALL